MSEQYYQNIFNPFLNGKTKGDYKGPFTHNTTVIVSVNDTVPKVMGTLMGEWVWHSVLQSALHNWHNDKL